MSERARNIVVGVTALAGLVGMIYLLMLFGRMPLLMEKGYAVSVKLPTAAGLTEGSRVRMSGIDVGRVKGVKFQQPMTAGVVALTIIREEIRLPADAVVRVEAPVLGGTPWLSFDTTKVPPDRLEAMLPTDGSAEVTGQAASVGAMLEDALREPTEQIRRLVDSFEKLGDEWTAVGRNINQLTAPRSTADVDAGSAQANLATVLARADARLAEMKQTLAGLNEWAADAELRRDVKETVANARNVTEKLSTGVDKLQDVADRAGSGIENLQKKYVAVADDLAGAIGEMKQAISQARQGQGTIGKLINDPSLYNNLNDAAQRLDAALGEVRTLIQKWKAEGLPLQYE